VHYNGAKPQNCIVKKFAPKAVKVCCPYRAQDKKAFLSTSNVLFINFFETFISSSPSSLRQDLMVKIAIFILFFSFGLLELEMPDLSYLLRKMTFVL
jgi:hypothetical protein